MAATPDALPQVDGLPPDLLRATDAAAIACCSTSTLRRWADETPPRIGQWIHPTRSGYFYSRQEVEAIRAEFRRKGA